MLHEQMVLERASSSARASFQSIDSLSLLCDTVATSALMLSGRSRWLVERESPSIFFMGRKGQRTSNAGLGNGEKKRENLNFFYLGSKTLYKCESSQKCWNDLQKGSFWVWISEASEGSMASSPFAQKPAEKRVHCEHIRETHVQ